MEIKNIKLYYYNWRLVTAVSVVMRRVLLFVGAFGVFLLLFFFVRKTQFICNL
jgi:hypothetical protein